MTGFLELVFNVELEEIRVVKTQYVTLSKEQVKHAKNASTVKRGVKQAKTQTSMLTDILNSSVFSGVKQTFSNFFGGGDTL